MENIIEDSGFLFVGKDVDYSSVYLVKESFVQDVNNFKVKVRFVLEKTGQVYQIHHNYLKDRGIDLPTLVHIDELWEFDTLLNNFRKLHVSYLDNERKLIYESKPDDPQWTSLKKLSRDGFVNHVFQISMNQLVAKDKFNIGTESEAAPKAKKKISRQDTKNENIGKVILIQIEMMLKKPQFHLWLIFSCVLIFLLFIKSFYFIFYQNYKIDRSKFEKVIAASSKLEAAISLGVSQSRHAQLIEDFSAGIRVAEVLAKSKGEKVLVDRYKRALESFILADEAFDVYSYQQKHNRDLTKEAHNSMQFYWALGRSTLKLCNESY